MKPLPPAMFTREDALIWLRINLPLRKPAPRPLLIVAYLTSDRRDAALMLSAQHQRRRILFGPVDDPPQKWVRMRGGDSFADFLRESLGKFE